MYVSLYVLERVRRAPISQLSKCHNAPDLLHAPLPPYMFNCSIARKQGCNVLDILYPWVLHSIQLGNMKVTLHHIFIHSCSSRIPAVPVVRCLLYAQLLTTA